VYSRWVKPHLRHLKNCVEDSSEPRVCTCQMLAVLFPHLGHSIRIVGSVWSSCSSFPMTATSCFGLCSMIFPFTFPLVSASGFLCPHLVQASISNACFPEWIFTGFSSEPQSEQNSMFVFSSAVLTV
jgi:hypothetical protein